MKLFWIALGAVLLFASAGRADPFFGPSERIVFVGNDFFEREARRAFIETTLTIRCPEKNLIFRNLGYSGDTVSGDGRNLCAGWDNFGPPDQGFNRLKGLIEHIQPTIVFVAYGMNESFNGPAGLSDFQRGLGHMLDMLSANKARLVLISPIRHERLPPPLPDPAAHNQNLALYVRAIRAAAAQRHCACIDLFNVFPVNSEKPLTSDEIHLNDTGYYLVADDIAAQLCPPEGWLVEIGAHGDIEQCSGTTVSKVQTSESGLTFDAQDAMLPPPPPPGTTLVDERILHVTGLRAGRYQLKINGEVVADASAEQWAAGVALGPGPAERQEEELRQLILAKNADFFNYSRPQNDTYIFGYRKHEQGRNAVEIPKFEELAKQKDAQIAGLRVPPTLHYTLVRHN
jgi:lysophospholipase L1-like esterase